MIHLERALQHLSPRDDHGDLDESYRRRG
jgi:hypothetical protein